MHMQIEKKLHANAIIQTTPRLLLCLLCIVYYYLEIYYDHGNTFSVYGSLR